MIKLMFKAEVLLIIDFIIFHTAKKLQHVSKNGQQFTIKQVNK